MGVYYLGLFRERSGDFDGLQLTVNLRTGSIEVLGGTLFDHLFSLQSTALSSSRN